MPIVVLGALALTGCAIEDEPEQVATAIDELGGPNAVLTTTGELEAVVNIGNCSGTLISQDTVITAAHCVCSSTTYPATGCATRKTVRFTSVVPAAGGARQDVTVGASVLVYPEFNHGGWLVNDYALLRLDTRADAIVRVAPLRLSSQLPITGQSHTLVGYGGTSGPCDGSFGTKRKGSSVLDSIVTYAAPGGRTLVFGDTALHACPGDSGGPVIASNGQIVGVCSTGDFSTNSNYDATAEAWSWIRANACTAADAPASAATCREGPVLATMYRNASYGGISQSFGAGRWPVGDLTVIGNDTISSLWANAGAIVRLWAEGGCWGDSATYAANVADVGTLLNNRTSCLEVQPGVTLHASTSYGGVKQALPIGGYSHVSLGAIGNDQAESLIAAPGIVVRVCAESGYPGTTGWGTCQDFSGAVSSLGGLNNNASNVEVSAGVTVYRDASFSGISQTFRPGVHGSSALTVVGNDTISSLVVGPGLQARICSENGGWGDCQTYTGAVSAVTAILNNRTSNIEITAVP